MFFKVGPKKLTESILGKRESNSKVFSYGSISTLLLILKLTLIIILAFVLINTKYQEPNRHIMFIVYNCMLTTLYITYK